MRLRKTIAIAIAIVAVAAVLAACTSPRAGAPTAGTGTTTGAPTSSSKDDTHGAPRVSHPLDATRFLSQPCSVLNPTQMVKFSISKPGEPDTDSEIAKASGPGCLWKADGEPSRMLDMSFLTGNKKGLSDTFRGRDRFDYFEETMVDGYPAVFNDGTDGRPKGICQITVGISDSVTFRASEHGGASRGLASCDGAKELAAAVIATLKGGS